MCARNTNKKKLIQKAFYRVSDEWAVECNLITSLNAYLSLVHTLTYNNISYKNVYPNTSHSPLEKNILVLKLQTWSLFLYNISCSF